ncbi:MAG: ATP-binding cassette domain-containing protein, partial [Phycisphaerales bacterium JB038]
DWGGTKVGQYSKGMQQRVGLAQALMNDPQLILLDEPTDGVDPVGRRDIRDLLVRLREQGKTIFLNSHLLSELEMVCDRVTILVEGEVRTQGTIDDLTKESWHYRVAVEGQPPTWLKDTDGVRVQAGRDGRMELRLPHADADKLQPVIDRLRSEGTTIVAIEPKRESLEDLFLRAVESEESPPEAAAAPAEGGAA